MEDTRKSSLVTKNFFERKRKSPLVKVKTKTRYKIIPL